MGTSGRVESINRSSGSVPKDPVEEAWIAFAGVEGDRQRHVGPHGGPDRAVCLYSRDLIEALRAEGHPIRDGLIGENLTLSGVDWALLTPGARIDVGEARLEITVYAAPCATISSAFHDKDFSRVSEEAHPGWSRVCARVLREGRVRAGDVVTLGTGA